MAYDIRPLSFSEVLARALRVYVDNFVLLIGIAAIALIPTGIVRGWSEGGPTITVILGLVFLVLGELAMHAAMVSGTASVYLGRAVSVLDSYRSARPVMARFIGVSLLYLLIMALSAATLAGAGFCAHAVSIRPLLASLGIVALLPGLLVEAYYLVCWRLLGPAIVIERNFGESALNRSRALIKGGWWRTLAFLLTTIFIDFVPYHFFRLAWGFVPVVGVIFGHAMLAVFGTYATVAFVIYYFDRRCRTEAFDPAVVAAQLDAQAEAALAVRSSALAPNA